MLVIHMYTSYQIFPLSVESESRELLFDRIDGCDMLNMLLKEQKIHNRERRYFREKVD